MDEQELTGMERYESAASLLMEMLDCGAADVDVILDLIRTHEDTGELVEYAAEFIEDVGGGWNFGAFISGVEHLVLSALQDRVSDDLHDALATVTIDNNYLAWGGVADSGNPNLSAGDLHIILYRGGVADSGDLDLETAEVFAEMCKEGVTDERVKRLIEAYDNRVGMWIL